MSVTLSTDTIGRERVGPRRKGLLKDQLELEKTRTKDGRVRVTVKPFEDQLSFDKGFFVFIRAIQLLSQHNEGIIVVGLAGPSGSGKTAFSEKVKSFLPDVFVLSMDNYNDGSKVVDGNFDDPRLIDFDLLLTNIRDLVAGKPVEIPIYDFKQSKRVGYKPVGTLNSRIVIIEGIYALSDKLAGLIDLKVSITGGVHFDLVKRVLRDLDRSGQAADEIIQQISDTVYPMYKAFIEPDLKTAQLKIYNTFNPFTGFMNATYILKSQEKITIEQAQSVLKKDHSRRTDESDIVDIYLLPPNEGPETCSSWLRMRNRDGRYSLMFEEWVTEGPFIISPRISFEVSVRILGGLMALGYEIGTILKRKTITLADDDIVIKFDSIDKLGEFIQLQGKDRKKMAEAGKKLGLEGKFLPRSYIEQVQLEQLTAELKNTIDLREHFGVNGDLFGVGSPLYTPDFTHSMGPSSLPARLETASSAPIPIASNRSSPTNGHVNGNSKTRNGLLTQKMRNSEDGELMYGGTASPPPSEMTANVMQLCDRLDRVSSNWSGEAIQNLSAQIVRLNFQCERLQNSVDDLSQVVTRLAEDIGGVAKMSSHEAAAAPSSISAWHSGLACVGLGALMAAWVFSGRNR